MHSDDSEIDRRNQEALESLDRVEPPEPLVAVEFSFDCAVCGDEAVVKTSGGWRCADCFTAL